MSDRHHLRTQPSQGEVEHVNFLSENIGELFMQDDYSDVILLVESVRFPAHKVILAARSDYFRALLFGGLKESRPECTEIELKDTTSSAFKFLLRYIYTGRICLTDMKEEILLDVLGLAHQYGFIDLEGSISDYLKAILNIRNVCLIYDIASMYSLCSLCETCCEFMDEKATEIIKSEALLTLSGTALSEVISRNSFCAVEIDVFKAVRQWAERNPDESLVDIVCCVRLPLMSLEDLLNIVRPSNLVSADSILDAIKMKNESRDMELNYRGSLTPEENVAILRHGAQVIRGEMKASLLDGDCQNYDLDRGFTRHPMDDNNGQGIVVRLANPCIINAIKMLLWDRDMRSYSYYIEVSMDDKDWVRVVDHTRFLCRSWQYLRFPERVVRYIRVVGTHNTVNRVFHLVCLEAFFSKKNVLLENGVIVPQENVATVPLSACVIEGVSRSRNALINGDTKNYDWDSGYTCHQLGSGAIVVQLAQCYIIGSMRLLLWDCDGRSYSYYIEVSTDEQHWHLVADKTKEACRSWQTIVFEKRPVTFIKIVGTHNTANEVFHCVHFECPGESNVISELDQGRCGSSMSQDYSAGGANGLVLSSRRMDLPDNNNPESHHEDDDEDREIVAAALAMAPMAHLPPTNPVLGSQQQQQQGIPQNMPLLDRGETLHLPVGIVRPRGSNGGMGAGMQPGFNAMSANPVGASPGPSGAAAAAAGGGAGPLGAVGGGGASPRPSGPATPQPSPTQPQSPPLSAALQAPRSPAPEEGTSSGRSSRSGNSGQPSNHSRSSSNSSGSPASPR